MLHRCTDGLTFIICKLCLPVTLLTLFACASFTKIVWSWDTQAVCLQRTRNTVWWSACFKLDQVEIETDA